MTARFIADVVPIAGFRVAFDGGYAQIECCELGQPRLSFSLPARLSMDQWQCLREGIDRAFRKLTIACECGHAFSVHASESPHGCAWATQVRDAHGDRVVESSGSPKPEPCPCDRFMAAEPIWTRPEP